MKNKKLMILFLILLAFLIVCVAFVLKDRHARIDEWSGSLIPEKLEWAQFSQGYGIEKIHYDLSVEEYETLISYLQAVTESNCTRNYPKGIEQVDYRLALMYDGKLWLFHCYSDEYISITFDSAETAAYYGCEDSPLILRNDAFWNHIVSTVDEKAE